MKDKSQNINETENDNENEIAEDTTIECPHCTNDAELITADEGGTETYWCEICGSLIKTFFGDDNPEVRTPIGI